MPKFKYEVTPGLLDPYREINIASLMKLLQRAAVDHSNQIGLTTEWYNNHLTTWVARSHSLHYEASLEPDNSILVSTEIEDCSRARSLRNYEVTQGGSNKVKAYGYTDWIYMDQSEGTIKRIPEDVKETLNPKNQNSSMNRPSFDLSFDSSTDFEKTYTVQFRDLDTQTHVNNTVYLNYLVDMVWSRFTRADDSNSLGDNDPNSPLIKELKIKYSKPAQWGEKLEGSLITSDETRTSKNYEFYFQNDSKQITAGTVSIEP